MVLLCCTGLTRAQVGPSVLQTGAAVGTRPAVTAWRLRYFKLTVESCVAGRAFTSPIDVHTDTPVLAKTFLFTLVPVEAWSTRAVRGSGAGVSTNPVLAAVAVLLARGRLVFRCIDLQHHQLCLAEFSSEGGGTNAGEVGHLIDALSSTQAGLRLAFVYVCLTQDTSVARFTHTGETAGALNTQRVVEARFVFGLVNVCFTLTPCVSRWTVT